MNNNGKKYLKLALPSGFECIVGILISVTDTFMISQFGATTVAAVGAMGTVIDFMYLILQSINVSNNVMVARWLGKGEKKKIESSTGTALIIAILSSIFCMLILLFIGKFLPMLFKIDTIGLTYLYIRLVGMIPNTILTILSGYQRTLGNSKKMLNIRVICFLLNALLDWVLVKQGFGVMGVAISTVIVEILNMTILIYYCKNNVNFKFDKDIYKEQINLIKYNVYERVFKRGSNLILNVIMSRIGSIQYAAHLIEMQFIDLINNFLHGLGIGTQTMIATTIGSDNDEQKEQTLSIVKEINKRVVYITTLIIGISLCITLPYFLIERESLVIGYKLIGFILIDCILSGFYQYYSSILRALKEFKYISKLSLEITVILRLILALGLSHICGIYGIWICFIISDFIMNTFLKRKIEKEEL